MDQLMATILYNGEIPDIKDNWLVMYCVCSFADSGYIGTPEAALRLFNRGIRKISTLDGSQKTCGIGFNDEEQKWYGWSHRAMHGFGVGDTVKEGDCCAIPGYDDEYLKEHPEKDFSLPVGFTARTLNDAKMMAIAYADSVS